MKKIRVLNLYSGIGGNRLYWDDIEGVEVEVTAVEFDPAIAEAYRSRFPNDTVVVGDAKQYLLDHYKEFDFIWASPPCQTHTKVRQCRVDTNPKTNKMGVLNAVYADMSLYQIILFLTHNNPNSFSWVVENVKPYYSPLIKETSEIDRHLYWSNFDISIIAVSKSTIIEFTTVKDCDFDLKSYGIKRVQQVIRNQVNYDVGKHILECALDKVTHRQGGLF